MTTPAERLNNHMETNITYESTPQEQFTIQNMEQANWAMRKLAKIEAEKSEIKKLARQEKEKIELWEKNEIQGLEGSADYFRSLLADYHALVLKENPRKKH